MLVGEIGEEKLLEEIRRIFAASNSSLPVAIGDDGAVVDCPPGTEQVWTSDLLVEGVHFRKDWQSPSQLGRKSLAVNLSDLAAMAAKPATALLSLSFSSGCDVGEITDFCRGFCEVALDFGVAVAGGDLSGSPGGMVISVAAGGTVEAGAAVLRSGAAPGETIFVTGRLGSAAAGLRIIDSGGARGPGEADLVRSFLEPEPRCREGQALAEAGVSAMTDISDGLSTDLTHICTASGTGGLIDTGSIPVADNLRQAARDRDWDVSELIMCGGEDYELLFTADESKAGGAIRACAAESGIGITAIGSTTAAAAGLMMSMPGGGEKELQDCGFDHFGGGDVG